MEESNVVQLDDWRFVVCDCCIGPVRRKDVRLLSRKGYSDKAEICVQCIDTYFNEEPHKYTVQRR
jgi:hypothetical protein